MRFSGPGWSSRFKDQSKYACTPKKIDDVTGTRTLQYHCINSLIFLRDIHKNRNVNNFLPFYHTATFRLTKNTYIIVHYRRRSQPKYIVHKLLIIDWSKQTGLYKESATMIPLTRDQISLRTAFHRCHPFKGATPKIEQNCNRSPPLIEPTPIVISAWILLESD